MLSENEKENKQKNLCMMNKKNDGFDIKKNPRILPQNL